MNESDLQQKGFVRDCNGAWSKPAYKQKHLAGAQPDLPCCAAATAEAQGTDVAAPLPAKPRPYQAKGFTITVEPVAAPRMTRRDRWLSPRRPPVQKYFDYRDALRAAVGKVEIVPDELHCLFFVPMPQSWSQKQRRKMLGKPHRQRPDRDNFDKAVCDALFSEDGAIWKGSQEKIWADTGCVKLELIWRNKQ